MLYQAYNNTNSLSPLDFLKESLTHFRRKFQYKPKFIYVNFELMKHTAGFTDYIGVTVECDTYTPKGHCKIGPLTIREPRRLVVNRQPLEVL